MSALPFLIIETGHPVSGMKRYGRFPHWIRVAAGLAERETVVIDVANGDRLPDRRGFAGTLISGSAAFVTIAPTGASAAPSGCAMPPTPACPC